MHRIDEHDSCHVPGRMSVNVCEGGEGEYALSHSTHTYTHTYTYTQVFSVRRGGEGGVIDVVSPESGWEIPHCPMYECIGSYI